MPKIDLMPMVGMNNRQADDYLQMADRQYGRRFKVRDAINVDFQPTGEVKMRKSGRQLTSQPYENLWQSPLHKDVFGEIAGACVVIDMNSMSHRTIGVTGGNNAYTVVNNRVMIAGANDIYKYDGSRLTPLSVDTPPQPIVDVGDSGNLRSGKYGIAVSWISDVEGSVSYIEHVEIPVGTGAFDDTATGSLHVTLPMCYDDHVKSARIYITNPNGTELLLHSEHTRSEHRIDIFNIEHLSAPPQFQSMRPMPTGKYLKYWNGRLISASKNVLHFSEAMAYHINSPVYGYIEMPQRITFVEPLETGIWVGQTTGVVFLQGRDLNDMNYTLTGALSPVPDSAITLHSDDVRSVTQDGDEVVMWLADNGYVIGNSQGQVVELQNDDMIGISGSTARTVVANDRITTLLK